MSDKGRRVKGSVALLVVLALMLAPGKETEAQGKAGGESQQKDVWDFVGITIGAASNFPECNADHRHQKSCKTAGIFLI